MNCLLKRYFPPGIAFDFFNIPVNLYVSASDLLLLNNLISMCLQTWLQQETKWNNWMQKPLLDHMLWEMEGGEGSTSSALLL